MLIPKSGWAMRIFGTLTQWFTYLFDWMTTNIPILRPLGLARGLGFLTPSEEKRSLPIFDALYEVPDLPEDVRQSLDFWKWMVEKTDIPLDSIMAFMGLRTVMEGHLAPVAVKAAYTMARKVNAARIDPTTAWIMRFKGLISYDDLRAQLRDQGWSGQLIDAYEGFTARQIEFSESLQLYWRGNMSRSEFLVNLHKLGFSYESIDKVKVLSERIPAPPDLIAMAVREAFHPELIAKYHYMDAFPPEFAEYMAKQGYSREWAEKWWVAHWRLPSITAGFEMLHRGLIDIDDLRDLLRTADIAPVWHEPLIQMAYQPYTRVDTRRMHALGILDDADLVKAYMDQGYDLEHAANMAEFTILYNTDTEREASKTDILKGYRKGVLSTVEATNALIAIGYPLHLAEYYLSLEDLHAYEEIAEEEIKTVETLYVNREIDRSQAYARLGALNLTATQITKLFERWDIARQRKIVRPSVDNLETFYRNDLIDSPRLETELANRGYLPEYVAWYRDSLLIEIERDAQTEQDRAAKEAERIAKQEEATAYQVDKAQIDYRIAQLRTQDTHLRILREQAIDTEERRRLEMTIEESLLRITEIQRDIAGKRTRLQAVKARIRALEVAPDLLSLYDRRDDLSLQVAETSATVADVRALLVETQSLIRQARVSGEVERLRTQVDALTVHLADSRADLARLRVEIAEINVEIAETLTEIETTKTSIRQLEVAREVLELYDLKDALSIQIAELQANVADIRVELVDIQAQIARHSVSPDILAQRETVDDILLDIALENEQIAEERVTIATVRATLAIELSSEQVATLDEQRRTIQLDIRRLQEERARLRI